MQPSLARLDRDTALAWYRKNRARTARLFDLLTDAAYYAQPITLRHPIVFYEGHIPAFSLNTLVKTALGRAGVDERLERLFARGIDPDEAGASGAPTASTAEANRARWPDRGEVRRFVDAADALVIEALTRADIDVPGHPLLDRANAVYTILEHEAMHQETLLYIWHRLPFEQKRAPADYRPTLEGPAATVEAIPIPAGTARLGARPGELAFGWDNELGTLDVPVNAFSIESQNVSNGAFLEFVESGGYARQDLWTPENWAWVQEHGLGHPSFWEREGDIWMWRGMFERLPLPLQWPVYVSHAEASAYARWRGGRLPTEAEYHLAASPFPTEGVFDFMSWDPHPVGSYAPGRTRNGVEDLVGNGWEWTSTIFAPYPGFSASASYPEYSADFFDGAHYVMRGASPATARELVRPTFRNWFRPRYPYVYATFRCVTEAA